MSTVRKGNCRTEFKCANVRALSRNGKRLLKAVLSKVKGAGGQFETPERMKVDAFEYIEVYYNPEVFVHDAEPRVANAIPGAYLNDH